MLIGDVNVPTYVEIYVVDVTLADEISESLWYILSHFKRVSREFDPQS